MHNRRVLHLTLTMSMTQSSLFVLHYVLPLFRYLLATFLYVIIMLSMHINDLVKFCDINTWVYLNINVFIRNLETFRHPTCIYAHFFIASLFFQVYIMHLYASLRFSGSFCSLYLYISLSLAWISMVGSDDDDGWNWNRKAKG